MATFRKIHTIFWSDPFIQSISPEKKYFYLYLLTNEKTKQCGIYEITKHQISYDTGYNIDTVSILLRYFIDTVRIQYSQKTNEIAIKNWAKYNNNKSPKVQKLVNEELKNIKNKSLIEYLENPDTVSIHYQTESSLEVEEEREKEEEKEIYRERGENVIYDIEKYLKEHQKDWESICATTMLGNGQIKKILKKYHLWNVEKGCYPKAPLQLIAGFQRWLINENGYGNSNAKNDKSEAPPLQKIQ